MDILSAKFIASYPSVEKCGQFRLPEFAFIGRSNVGKSSLINMLTGIKSLAKVSQTPGKTQTINYFEVNQSWFLVDLPGYGYAKVSKGLRNSFSAMITQYITKRENLYSLFVLIDSRHEPQKIDIEFINWAGQEGIPLSLVFTKADKISKGKLEQNVELFRNALLETWEILPNIFITSAVTKQGHDQILSYIEEIVESC